jgi:hypothetical protein
MAYPDADRLPSSDLGRCSTDMRDVRLEAWERGPDRVFEGAMSESAA